MRGLLGHLHLPSTLTGEGLLATLPGRQAARPELPQLGIWGRMEGLLATEVFLEDALQALRSAPFEGQRRVCALQGETPAG